VSGARGSSTGGVRLLKDSLKIFFRQHRSQPEVTGCGFGPLLCSVLPHRRAPAPSCVSATRAMSGMLLARGFTLAD
jgi:hypothetical protein